MGSLQEIDHVPFSSTLCRYAVTAESAAAAGDRVDDAALRSARRPEWPSWTFRWTTCSARRMTATNQERWTELAPSPLADGDALDRAVAVLSAAQRPVIMAGTNVWWGHAERELVHLAETLQIPVFANGMARGIVGADRNLAFSRARSAALSGPTSRWSSGCRWTSGWGSAGFWRPNTVDRRRPARTGASTPRAVAAELYGNLRATLTGLAGAASSGHEEWVAQLRTVETAARAAEAAELADDRTRFTRCASTPNSCRCWTVTPSSSSTPGTSAPRRARNRQLCAGILAGQRTLPGVSDRDPDTRWRPSWRGPSARWCSCRVTVLRILRYGMGHPARHDVHVVSVIGNNGIWGWKSTRWRCVMAIRWWPTCAPDPLRRGGPGPGGHGELVASPAELRPALRRAFDSGIPTVVNVLTDPAVAYPRRSNLA